MLKKIMGGGGERFLFVNIAIETMTDLLVAMPYIIALLDTLA